MLEAREEHRDLCEVDPRNKDEVQASSLSTCVASGVNSFARD